MLPFVPVFNGALKERVEEDQVFAHLTGYVTSGMGWGMMQAACLAHLVLMCHPLKLV